MSLHGWQGYAMGVVVRGSDAVQAAGVVGGLVGAGVEFGGAGLLIGGGVLFVIGWAMRAIRLAGTK